ncbi:hypothetical protein J8C02_13365 [Chloracidobacterium sp. MS 40/45]|uniref:hypothetical protein n=1 Tax=Chloracidobacterium aggregatum TaxID=2851959 RepID=UPI001B8AEC02|nr:hypothetical protein [Chloracidobacterium aggregatum]QUW01134.1 hypothetical protein J8C02_13365 [Chloracidobacterium sp. MS 40/45]
MTMERQPRRLKWLGEVQKAYPGARRVNSETHGLDSDFARQTYVPTGLEEALYRGVINRRFRLVILCGNAGDGKTALLQKLAGQLGIRETRQAGGTIEHRLPDGLRVRLNLDGSAAWETSSSNDLLNDLLRPFANGAPAEDIVHLLAINDGRLMNWLDGQTTPLAQSLRRLLDGQPSDMPHIGFFHLNNRSLVGEFDQHGNLRTAFLDRLLDQLYGGAEAGRVWQKCQTCVAQPHCRVFEAARYFGPANLSGIEDERRRQHARQQLYRLFQAVHQRGKIHITVRELRGALVYILFGMASCDTYCKADGTKKPYPPFWERAFRVATPDRQGQLLKELASFDPALEAHARFDRALLRHYRGVHRLAEARRRAYFTWLPEEIEQAGGPGTTLDLARGRHLDTLRRLPLMSGEEKQAVLVRLGRGLSRLEPLPQPAYRPGRVPFRLHPRTPTDTIFWVETRLEDFALESVLLGVRMSEHGQRGLPEEAFLVYHLPQGGTVRLRLTADLFHALLELEGGYQLSAATLEQTFAHLSLFIEQVVHAQNQTWYAWHPAQEERVYRLAIETRDLGFGYHQTLRIVPEN